MIRALRPPIRLLRPKSRSFRSQIKLLRLQIRLLRPQIRPLRSDPIRSDQATKIRSDQIRCFRPQIKPCTFSLQNMRIGLSDPKLSVLVPIGQIAYTSHSYAFLTPSHQHSVTTIISNFNSASTISINPRLPPHLTPPFHPKP